ncbi:hypothetical protein ACTXT7_012669 [Hymenolepis weldensis]
MRNATKKRNKHPKSQRELTQSLIELTRQLDPELAQCYEYCEKVSGNELIPVRKPPPLPRNSTTQSRIPNRSPPKTITTPKTVFKPPPKPITSLEVKLKPMTNSEPKENLQKTFGKNPKTEKPAAKSKLEEKKELTKDPRSKLNTNSPREPEGKPKVLEEFKSVNVKESAPEESSETPEKSDLIQEPFTNSKTTLPEVPGIESKKLMEYFHHFLLQADPETAGCFEKCEASIAVENLDLKQRSESDSIQEGANEPKPKQASEQEPKSQTESAIAPKPELGYNPKSACKYNANLIVPKQEFPVVTESVCNTEPKQMSMAKENVKPDIQPFFLPDQEPETTEIVTATLPAITQNLEMKPDLEVKFSRPSTSNSGPVQIPTQELKFGAKPEVNSSSSKKTTLKLTNIERSELTLKQEPKTKPATKTEAISKLHVSESQTEKNDGTKRSTVPEYLSTSTGSKQMITTAKSQIFLKLIPIPNAKDKPETNPATVTENTPKSNESEQKWMPKSEEKLNSDSDSDAVSDQFIPQKSELQTKSDEDSETVPKHASVNPALKPKFDLTALETILNPNSETKPDAEATKAQKIIYKSDESNRQEEKSHTKSTTVSKKVFNSPIILMPPSEQNSQDVKHEIKILNAPDDMLKPTHSNEKKIKTEDNIRIKSASSAESDTNWKSIPESENKLEEKPASNSEPDNPQKLSSDSTLKPKDVHIPKSDLKPVVKSEPETQLKLMPSTIRKKELNSIFQSKKKSPFAPKMQDVLKLFNQVIQQQDPAMAQSFEKCEEKIKDKVGESDSKSIPKFTSENVLRRTPQIIEPKLISEPKQVIKSAPIPNPSHKPPLKTEETIPKIFTESKPIPQPKPQNKPLPSTRNVELIKIYRNLVLSLDPELGKCVERCEALISEETARTVSPIPVTKPVSFLKPELISKRAPSLQIKNETESNAAPVSTSIAKPEPTTSINPKVLLKTEMMSAVKPESMSQDSIKSLQQLLKRCNPKIAKCMENCNESTPSGIQKSPPKPQPPSISKPTVKPKTEGKTQSEQDAKLFILCCSNQEHLLKSFQLHLEKFDPEMARYFVNSKAKSDFKSKPLVKSSQNTNNNKNFLQIFQLFLIKAYPEVSKSEKSGPKEVKPNLVSPPLLKSSTDSSYQDIIKYFRLFLHKFDPEMTKSFNNFEQSQSEAKSAEKSPWNSNSDHQKMKSSMAKWKTNGSIAIGKYPETDNCRKSGILPPVN